MLDSLTENLYNGQKIPTIILRKILNIFSLNSERISVMLQSALTTPT